MFFFFIMYILFSIALLSPSSLSCPSVTPFHHVISYYSTFFLLLSFLTPDNTTPHHITPHLSSASANADAEDEEDEFDDDIATTSYHSKHEKGGGDDSDDENDGLRKEFVKTEKSVKKQSHSQGDLTVLGADGALLGPIGGESAAAR